MLSYILVWKFAEFSRHNGSRFLEKERSLEIHCSVINVPHLVVTSYITILSSKRKPHFQTDKRSWNEHELVHGFRVRPETKNDCAVEGQQQFTGRDTVLPNLVIRCKSGP
jgi:hypothetical protein